MTGRAYEEEYHVTYALHRLLFVSTEVTSDRDSITSVFVDAHSANGYSWRRSSGQLSTILAQEHRRATVA
jgi:hypothetical protein